MADAEVRFKRGTLSGLPSGAAGQPLLTTDQVRLYVGSAAGNRLVGLLDKIDGTVAPTVNDDAGDGFSVGSVWVDTTASKSYICTNSTIGAAVWQQFSGTGSGGGGTVTSVGVSGANGIGVSGSPVVGSGVIALTLPFTLAGSGTLTNSGTSSVSGTNTGDQTTIPTVVYAVNQTAHGLVAKDCVRCSGSNTYVKAQADSASNAEVVGFVYSVVDANNFTLVTGGYANIFTGLTAGAFYFLDPTTAGAITITEPTASGQVSKPVLLALSATAGLVENLRGVIQNGVSNPIITAGDIEVTDSSKGLILRSPDGNRWRIKMSNGGTINITGPV